MAPGISSTDRMATGPRRSANAAGDLSVGTVGKEIAVGYFQLGTWMRTEAPRAYLRDSRGRLRAAFLKSLTGACPPELWEEFKEWAVCCWAPAWRAQQRGDMGPAKALKLPAPGPERFRVEIDTFGEARYALATS